MYFSEWREIQENMNRQKFEMIYRKFLPFAVEFLRIKKLPKIKFIENSSYAKKVKTFGRTIDNNIEIYIKNRHPMDILRTVAHELVHYSQIQKGIIGSGETGSSTENEANKLAGVLMRKFGETYSEYFKLPPVS